jgi:hypothetical protein
MQHLNRSRLLVFLIIGLAVPQSIFKNNKLQRITVATECKYLSYLNICMFYRFKYLTIKISSLSLRCKTFAEGKYH